MLKGGLTSPSPWINDDPIYGPVNGDNDSGQVKRNNYLAGWWLDEAKDDSSLRHKMTYFYLQILQHQYGPLIMNFIMIT